MGAELCASCHADEAERWRGSHHDRAMELPSRASVLAPFAGEELEHFGVTTRFEREGDSFRVRVTGESESPVELEVAYTFGVEPLQQLLVEQGDGRLQALQVAWDSRPEAEGGQRWFALQPDERPPPGDVLHWDGPAHNWNAMCADCHSTGLSRGWDAESGAYDTQYAEIDVACEACHGAGSQHVAWAQEGAPPGDPRRELVAGGEERAWRLEDGASIAYRDPTSASDVEIDVCAPCHSRRSLLVDEPRPGTPFLDAYRPALLDEGLYYADGQILEEVYVWGSFVQSRMFAAGVRCSDCHDPHGLAIADPDAVCSTCHSSEVFASEDHHRHEPDSPGSSCVGCHMPARTYMVVDDRRDHGFRVPRPDLSVQIGTPNACSGCHADHDDAWAEQAARRLWPDGRSGAAHSAQVLHAGRVGAGGAAEALAQLAADRAQPAMVRATAVRLMGLRPGPGLPAAVERAARDPEALVRMAAPEAAQPLPPEQRIAPLAALLGDERLAVRVEAARSLASAGRQALPIGERNRFDRALAELEAVHRVSADRPESHVALGNLHRAQGRVDDAVTDYQRAIALGPWFVPASINLADALREVSREDEGVAALRTALEVIPESGDLNHALGLALVRRGERGPAVVALGRAVELAPENPRYAFVYAVALRDAGAREQAAGVLAEAHERTPTDRALIAALASWALEDGDRAAAERWGMALLQRDPRDPLGLQVLGALRGPP